MATGAVATDPARSGWRYLSFRDRSGLADGEVVELDRPEQEAAIVTISGGGVEVAPERGPALALPGRTTVFAGMPWSAYIPAGTRTRIVGRPLPGQRAVVAVAQAPGTVGAESPPSRSSCDRTRWRSRSGAPATPPARSTTS